MILETRHLRSRCRRREHGTLTRAGRVLHLTQSGLSRQLSISRRARAAAVHRLGNVCAHAPGERLLVAARRALPS